MVTTWRQIIESNSEPEHLHPKLLSISAPSKLVQVVVLLLVRLDKKLEVEDLESSFIKVVVLMIVEA